MKIRNFFCVFAIIPLFPLSFAQAEQFIDTATVLKADPVVEKIYGPSEYCERRQQGSRQATSGDDAILGAILGGVIGSQVGSGSGQDAAAGVGAVLGAQLASGGGEFTAEQLLGALAGGVIGNQVGGGGGKTAATAIGAALGAALASGQLSRDRYAIESRCGRKHTVARNVITAYKIEYLYQGIVQQGTISYKPGDTIDVLVDVQIVEDATL